MKVRLPVVAWAALCLAAPAYAVSIETHENPVASGTITVAPGDNDRSDWVSIPAYGADPELDAGPEVDWTGLQVAHDPTTLYFHYLLYETETPEPIYLGFRHNIYVDADQNRSTGFVGAGSFLAVGADFLIQGASVYSFVGADQESWGWSEVSAGNPYDDFPDTDIEFAIPRAAIGNPTAFDFLLNGSNTDFLFEDFYPDASNGGVEGAYFTYAMSAAPELQGDYNNDNVVDAADYAVWRNSLNDIGDDLPADGNGDKVVNIADYNLWRMNYGAPAAPVATASTAPEPSAAVLLTLAAGAGVAGVTRRGRA